MKLLERVRWLIVWINNIGRPKTKKTTSKSVAARLMEPIANHEGRYIFFCPGCQANHLVDTNPRSGSYHTLTGTLENPTVRASVLVAGDKLSGIHRCHAFITDGRIEYLSDSTHALAGKTTKMEPV